MYIDEDGYAKDGYPLMMAKSMQLTGMYWGDYSWMEDPFNRKIKYDMFSPTWTLINVIFGGMVYALNVICGDLPAYISIITQMWEYFM